MLNVHRYGPVGYALFQFKFLQISDGFSLVYDAFASQTQIRFVVALYLIVYYLLSKWHDTRNFFNTSVHLNIDIN